MEDSIQDQLAQLRGMDMEELRTRYCDVFNTQPKTTNKFHLVRRIAWQIQMRTSGDLSSEALRLAAEIADEGLLNGRGDESNGARRRKRRLDSRLPGQGTELIR